VPAAWEPGRGVAPGDRFWSRYHHTTRTIGAMQRAAQATLVSRNERDAPGAASRRGPAAAPAVPPPGAAQETVEALPGAG
jgi:hypothetical protein